MSCVCKMLCKKKIISGLTSCYCSAAFLFLLFLSLMLPLMAKLSHCVVLSSAHDQDQGLINTLARKFQ